MATFRGRCAQVLLLISSERGQIYSFATPKLQPILVNEASKTLIEQCLNAPDPIAPLALGMPGMPQAMMPIDGQIDPNDPNAQQQYAEYAEGQYADPNAQAHYQQQCAAEPPEMRPGPLCLPPPPLRSLPDPPPHSLFFLRAWCSRQTI